MSFCRKLLVFEVSSKDGDASVADPAWAPLSCVVPSWFAGLSRWTITQAIVQVLLVCVRFGFGLSSKVVGHSSSNGPFSSTFHLCLGHGFGDLEALGHTKTDFLVIYN